jgi:hypothetical protein
MLGWALPIAAALASAGYIGLVFMAPQAAVAVEKVALDLLSRLTSTRIGCVALTAIVVGSGAYLYGEHAGADRIKTEWEAAKAQYAAAMEQKRAAAAAEAEQKVKAAQAAEETNADAEAKRIEDYAKTVSGPGSDDCRISDSDLAAAGGVRPKPRRNWRPFHKNP